MSFYFENITEKELDDIKKTLVYTRLRDKKHFLSDDGETMLLSSLSGKQSFGVTDYKDHTKDSDIELKRLIKNKLRCSQRGHFYDSAGEIVKTIVIEGYRGGYRGTFVYKTGLNAFKH